MRLILPANLPTTGVERRSRRFLFVVFLVRMWLCIEWRRITFPPLVILKRFLTPRCDFIFGTVRLS